MYKLDTYFIGSGERSLYVNGFSDREIVGNPTVDGEYLISIT